MSETNYKKQYESSQDNYIDFVPPKHKYTQDQPFSSAFFKDHCQQQYQIHRAFNTNNFTSLRTKIPNNLKYGAILQQRYNKVQEQTQTQDLNRKKPNYQKQQQRQMRITKKKMQQVGTLGYFQVFPYQESNYSNFHDLQKKQKQQSKIKRQMISQLQFRPSGFDKKMKYQNPFSYVQRLQPSTMKHKQNYIYPFHLPQDTFDRFHQSQLRNKYIQQSFKLAGEFIPSSNEKSLSKITKSKAPQIIKQIQVYIKKILNNIGFFIGLSKKDHIDILFQQKWKDNVKLNLLMSRICQNQFLSKYLLRRNANKWGNIGENGYLEYCLLPPWVKDIDEKLTNK